MLEKIFGNSPTRAADKAKKTAKTSGTGSPSFAELLNTQQADAQDTVDLSYGNTSTPYAPPPPPEDMPQSPQQAAPEILKTLEDLAADLMTATPTQKAHKLQQLMDHLPDTSSLSPEQKQVWDELATRAAVTLAKIQPK